MKTFGWNNILYMLQDYIQGVKQGLWFENETLTKIMPTALETMEMGLRRTWDRKVIWITQGLSVFTPWKPSVPRHRYLLTDTTNTMTLFPVKLFPIFLLILILF